MTLREVLHAHIPVLYADSTVRDAVDKMDIYQFPGLVIVDKDHAPIAVITEGDLVRVVAHRDSLVSMANEPALALATKDPFTLGPETEIAEAFHKMRASGLTLLPIVEDERLCGVVLRVDLMQALLLDVAQAS